MPWVKSLFICLFLAAGAAVAQQELAPFTSDGPLAIKPEQPKSDSDGVYAASPGVTAPLVIQRVPVEYPADVTADAAEGDCVLSMVIGADGAATHIEVVRSHGAAFDAAAIAAVRQSKFEPGTVGGRQVPVRMFARTRFFADARPTYPRFQSRFGPSPGQGWQNNLGPRINPHELTQPRPINTSQPEFTEAARRNKIQGVVTVSVLVTEEGNPIDPQVIHSLDPGLDEKAIECALNYRFRPAMRDGVPVATRINILINFHLY